MSEIFLRPIDDGLNWLPEFRWIEYLVDIFFKSRCDEELGRTRPLGPWVPEDLLCTVGIALGSEALD